MNYVDIQANLEPVTPESLDISTGSPGSLVFAKEWIERCINSHPQCNERRSDEIPARLLELSPDGPKCRLRNVSEMPSNPRYATLSHCWGNIEVFRLVMTNFELLCHDVPISKLCKTFRDGITATLALGLNYLWIDSLCIIQDDEEDWARESIRMSAVYGNAVANLAATDSVDGNGGLFFERDILRSTSPTFQTAKGRLYGVTEHVKFIKSMVSSPLAQRAWAFQERFLARRAVYFSAAQIFCQCREQTASESVRNQFICPIRRTSLLTGQEHVSVSGTRLVEEVCC